jgi:two-component system aerobic respiration control sensor histidine kinase ArcB
LHVIDETNIYLNSWLNKKTEPMIEDTHPSPIPSYLAGLPKTKSLFELDKYPLLDLFEALEHTGNIRFLNEVLLIMKDESVPEDLSLMKSAYALKDWDKVQQQAYKIRDSGVYVGTVRMNMACQYLEYYWKTGQKELLEELYRQALTIIHDTMIQITYWLDKQGKP